jgi:hypothetical protein
MPILPPQLLDSLRLRPHLEAILPDLAEDEYDVPSFLDLIIMHHPRDSPENPAVALVYHPNGLHEPPMDRFFPLIHLRRPEFRHMVALDTPKGTAYVGGDGHVDGVDLLSPEERPLWRKIGMVELAARFYFGPLHAELAMDRSLHLRHYDMHHSTLSTREGWVRN